MLGVHVLKGPSLFEHLRDPWQELAASDPSATPFQTWEWQSTWFKHYGRGKSPWAVCVYEGNDLIGLMTLVKFSGAWRSLRSLGVGPSDYLHPLVRAPEAIPLMWEFIESVRGIDLIDLHQIRETHLMADGWHEEPNQATCLVLDLPGSYDRFVGDLGKSLRYDVRKLDRSMLGTGKAAVETVSADKLQSGFEALVDLHRARWRSRKLPGAFVGRSLRFHREWIELAQAQGWLRLRLLRVEGQIVGAIYAMAFGQTAFYYQAGFDPAMRSYSPGNLLVAESVRQGIEEGLRQFDFMRGDEAYKRRWKPQHAWANKRIMIAGSSLRGGAALRWNDIASVMEGKLRARFEGSGTVRDTR